MKKVLKGLLFAFVGVFTVVALASCGGHEHKAKEGWVKDSSQHWHECEGCDEMLDAAIHTYGDWIVDTEPDNDKGVDGTRHKVCSVCGFNMKGTIPYEKDPTKLPDIYIRGGINGWGTGDEWKLTVSGTTATIKGVELKLNDEWKVADGDWGDFNMGFGNLADAAKEYFEDNGGNIKCKVAGTYTITVSDLLGSKTISVEKTA